MERKERIPTEILQLFTSAQAWAYRLVPYRKDDKLHCYGVASSNYETVLMEVEVLQGYPVAVEYVSEERLAQMLNHYYRKEETVGERVPRADFTRIGNGQNFLIRLIDDAFRDYASDIHFEPYEEKCRIRLRIDGKLQEKYVLDKTNYAFLTNQIKILSNLDISEKRLPQDGRILFRREDRKFDVRVSVLPTIYGEKAVLRLLTRHTELLDLRNLGFTEKQIADYIEAVNKPYGLVLICGPTGSGKSTTLYATLRMLNKETNNMLTIEDPVEYTLEGINQVQLKEEIGLTFTSALRTFLRQDPDIIMLGEIRDGDTAQMAIRSSLTGHLILSTIHTNSAWGSVARLTDMGVHPYLLSGTLLLCVAQRLVRLLCPHCKREVRIDNARRRELRLGKDSHIYESVGCASCYFTGYKGRRAIYEVIPVDGALSRAIRDSRDDIEDMKRERGIVSLEEAAVALVGNGETSLEEILPLLRSQ